MEFMFYSPVYSSGCNNHLSIILKFLYKKSYKVGEKNENVKFINH